MKEFRKIFPDMVAIMLFALIAFVYFFPAVTEDRILAQHDAVAGIGAGREMQEYREATGERTRWTNAIFGGMPTYQMSPSYDSSDTLNVVQKIYRLFLPDYVWYVFIMLLGFYILLRAFNFKVWMATLGAVIWAFSSYFFIIIAAGHIWKFVTLAYIPPTIAGMVLVYRGKYLWGAVVTALFVALQIMSNHPQMSYYFLFVIYIPPTIAGMVLVYRGKYLWGAVVTALFVALQIMSNHPQMSYYFLFVMLFMAMAYGVSAWKEKQMPRFLKASAVLVVSGLVGVCINLSNLYHTYQYSKESMRGKSELVKAVLVVSGLVGVCINLSNLYHTYQYSKESMRGKSELVKANSADQTDSGLERSYITQWSYGIGETFSLLVPNVKGGASVPLAQNEKAMEKANPMYSGGESQSDV